MTTPARGEREHTLLTAVTRFEELWLNLVGADPFVQGPALRRNEALELLALGQVIARKAAYGQQRAVLGARAAGASWAQIGTALGVSRQSAWEAHMRWLDSQARRPDDPGHEGLDEAELTRLREVAGGAAD
jgi:hypothetical protein